MDKLDNSYIYDISQLTGVAVNKVEEIFNLYRLYMLHEIACVSNTQNEIILSFPGFMKLKVSPYNHNQSTSKIRLSIEPNSIDRSQIRDAYYNKVDYLLNYFEQQMNDKLYTFLDDKLKEED